MARQPTRCGCRLSSAPKPGLGLEPDDGRDLHRNAQGELVGAERLAGVPAALAKHLEDQVGRAVEDLRLFLKAGRRPDEAAELNELLDPVQRAGVLPDQADDV